MFTTKAQQRDLLREERQALREENVSLESRMWNMRTAAGDGIRFLLFNDPTYTALFDKEIANLNRIAEINRIVGSK